MTNLLFTLYLGTGIFGLGISIIDLLGLLGDSDDLELEGPGDADGDVDADLDLDAGSDGEADIDGGGEEDADSDGESARGDIVVTGSGGRLLRFLGVVRSLIYFCMGFGPTGFAALLMDKPEAESLLWASGVGIATLLAARLIRRMLKKDLSSVVTSADMLMEKGKVIVSIGAGQIGRVRVSVGGTYVDRYAKCADSSETVKTGETVQVTDVDDQYIYVEKM